MSLEKLLEEADKLGILNVSANGPPSEALLRDSIKAEKEFRRYYGDTAEQNRALFKRRPAAARQKG